MLNTIYETGYDLHVANYVAYLHTDKKLYEDEAHKVQAKKADVEKAFKLGRLIVVATDKTYLPVALVAAGVVVTDGTTAPSVFTEKMTERTYYGDVLEFGRQMQMGDKVNPDITVGNQLSILADPFANDHLYDLRYAVFMGQKWQVTGVKVQYPRLILTLGGLWNGSTAEG